LLDANNHWKGLKEMENFKTSHFLVLQCVLRANQLVSITMQNDDCHRDKYVADIKFESSVCYFRLRDSEEWFDLRQVKFIIV
jgi:hypothetical protein